MDGSRNDQLVLMFAIGLAGILLIAGAILAVTAIFRKKRANEDLKKQVHEDDYRKKMLKAAFESQENERKKVSKDLHDDVGMMLMTMRVNLNHKNLTDTDDLKQLVDKAHDTIRRISWNLMPTTLENFGLANSLKEMCARLTSIDLLEITFKETGVAGQLDKNQEVLLYRIVQEAVNNSIKHANASHIAVKMVWHNGHLDLSVADDGHGFDISLLQNGHGGRHGWGIYNLENRATLLGGKLEYHKNVPRGTIMSVRLQLNANEVY